jgi:hypothetical protein
VDSFAWVKGLIVIPSSLVPLSCLFITIVWVYLYHSVSLFHVVWDGALDLVFLCGFVAFPMTLFNNQHLFCGGRVVLGVSLVYFEQEFLGFLELLSMTQ